MKVLTHRKKIEWFAHCYKIDTLLRAQLVMNDISTKFRDKILNSPLFWRADEDKWVVAFDLFTYIVVKHNEDMTAPVVIGYVDTHKFGGTVVDRFCKAYYKREKDERLGIEIQAEEAE